VTRFDILSGMRKSSAALQVLGLVRTYTGWSTKRGPGIVVVVQNCRGLQIRSNIETVVRNVQSTGGHSVEVGRYLLTKPGAPRNDLKLVSASATVGNLKWTRPEYVKRLKDMMGPEVDYATRPAEDFARGALIFVDPEGHEVMVEATNSWAYVGAGLRILIELLGPEYSMEFSSLNTGLKIFLSRDVRGGQGEDLVEKQNAEQGLMPVVENEADIYGYVGENRHMVDAFRHRRQPIETFHDGVAVAEMLMALYRSAEIGQVVTFPSPDLETYVPPVARH